MVLAEEYTVVDVGLTSRLPVLDVMDLAERGGLLAAGPHASALEGVQNESLRRLEESMLATEIER